MKTFLLIFLGGGTGSTARYYLQMLINRNLAEIVFPAATLAVNILGSFFIGLFFSLSVRFNLSYETRLMLIVGLCGGFTTFSTFSNENLNLLKNGHYLAFGCYSAASLLGGVICTWMGIWTGKNIF